MTEIQAYNSDRLREIAERAEKATPGPWTLEWDSAGSEYPEEDRPWPWRIENVCNIAEENNNNPNSDGAFIAAAREDIPFLLSEINKLNAEKAETIEVLEGLEPPRLTGSMSEAEYDEYQEAHAWLERHEELNKPLGPGQPRRGYIGLDHKLGENDDGCSLCHAAAALKDRLNQNKGMDQWA